MNRLFAASIETNRHHPYEATTFSGNWDCQRATSFLHADVCSQQVQTSIKEPTQEKSGGNTTLLGTNIFPPMVVFSKIFLFQERWDGDVLFPGRN